MIDNKSAVSKAKTPNPNLPKDILQAANQLMEKHGERELGISITKAKSDATAKESHVTVKGTVIKMVS